MEILFGFLVGVFVSLFVMFIYTMASKKKDTELSLIWIGAPLIACLFLVAFSADYLEALYSREIATGIVASYIPGNVIGMMIALGILYVSSMDEKNSDVEQIQKNIAERKENMKEKQKQSLLQNMLSNEDEDRRRIVYSNMERENRQADQARKAKEARKAEKALKDVPACTDKVCSLRNKILSDIKHGTHIRKYKLFALLFQDAASCFPGSGWDLAEFSLDLENRKISVYFSKYPNAFGYAPEATRGITFSDFHEIAMKYDEGKPYRAFVTEHDWSLLFNEELIAAYAEAKERVQKEKAIAREQERMAHRVKIPDELLGQTPNMQIEVVSITLNQMYGSSYVSLRQHNGKYILSDVFGVNGPITLSDSEAVWVERLVGKAVSDPSNETWSSLPGGDRMEITIKMQQGMERNLKPNKPLRKYSDLMDDLRKLAKYGSDAADKLHKLEEARKAEEKRKAEEVRKTEEKRKAENNAKKHNIPFETTKD